MEGFSVCAKILELLFDVVVSVRICQLKVLRVYIPLAFLCVCGIFVCVVYPISVWQAAIQASKQRFLFFLLIFKKRKEKRGAELNCNC
jgi:hypothetical protein